MSELDTLYNLGGSSGGTRPKILIRSEEHEWKKEYNARTSVERSNKREKIDFK